MEKLSNKQIEQFIEFGFVKIKNAFSQEIADNCRTILWKAIQVSPDDPETWTQPVIRIGEIGLEPFKQAANTTILHKAFNQLAFDNWVPRMSLGTFPIRFPGKEEAGDTGWHVDASFPGEDSNNYLEWRINIHSRGRALLMLFLFSNTTEKDAPTRIKAGSHLDVAKLLQHEGEAGLSFMELADKLQHLPLRKEITATGIAGTVYLCHPFLVHAAQQHRGTEPKFMAQPNLLSKRDFNINQPLELRCPIEKAIIKGIEN
ncbi:MAG: phytanoyl-CoA dioxygenase family protein [Saprospiraceae bacterium]|nr:phytanoyl-CoA dioxygenase family protein [Saprospiraceae bacterium]MBL0110237.1 phytanoyl-CoA dioxygenase family protein [Saprospiraceae bacterium]